MARWALRHFTTSCRVMIPDAARDLAYRLYHICERKGWAEDALDYNVLVSSWSEISRLAGVGSESGTQAELFDD